MLSATVDSLAVCIQAPNYKAWHMLKVLELAEARQG